MQIGLKRPKLVGVGIRILQSGIWMLTSGIRETDDLEGPFGQNKFFGVAQYLERNPAGVGDVGRGEEYFFFCGERAEEVDEDVMEADSVVGFAFDSVEGFQDLDGMDGETGFF